MKYDADGNLVPNPRAKMAITEATRSRLRTLETQAFEAGLSPAQLETQIESVINDPVRARLIANTDLAMAQTDASLTAWEESGLVTGRIWLLSNDHEIEDLCNDNAEAGVVPLGEDFPSGHRTCPGHPGCSCDCAAIVA